MSTRARRGLSALLVAALSLGGLALGAAPAAAGPTAIRLDGHGYGHGRGLGQWGAKGYAQDHGWSAAQILDHFYGGTTAGTRGNDILQVLLCDLEGVTICTTGPGLGQVIVTSSQPYQFEGIPNAFSGGHALRITADAPAGRFFVERSAGTGGCNETAFASVGGSGGGYVTEPILDLDPGGAPLQVCAPKNRTYRGGLKFVDNGDKARLVNFVRVEEYLRGVVPSEMPASWHAEALKAQAVAARSYALAGDSRFPGLAHTCDTIQCQVYLGLGNEKAATNAAIEATAGLVRIKGGAVARTEFSASTGGHTAGGAFPAVPDAGDSTAGNPHHNWSVTLQATQIEQAFPQIGDFLNIEVLERNGLGADGGRVRRARIVGSSGSVEQTGDQIRSRFALKSDWFTPSKPSIVLERIAGADRYETAATIARSAFQSADVAFLARGDGNDSFPDGLAANYAAGVTRGGGDGPSPTLLAARDSVPAVTLDALRALGVDTVRLIGGPAALTPEVESQLRGAGFAVERLGGDDRFATAATVGRSTPNHIGTIDGKKTAVLSSGRTFADALAAGGFVYWASYPQLLTEQGSLPAVTSSALRDLGIQHVIITGGPTAVSTAVEDAVEAMGLSTRRIGGTTRYDTAAMLVDYAIDHLGFAADHIDVATGETFPDALVGGTHTGRRKATLLLVPRSVDSLSGTSTCALLGRRGPGLASGHVLGGPTAVADNSKRAVEVCTAP
jgi:SpoIID/LytB domain protein